MNRQKSERRARGSRSSNDELVRSNHGFQTGRLDTFAQHAKSCIVSPCEARELTATCAESIPEHATEKSREPTFDTQVHGEKTNPNGLWSSISKTIKAILIAFAKYSESGDYYLFADQPQQAQNLVRGYCPRTRVGCNCPRINHDVLFYTAGENETEHGQDEYYSSNCSCATR